MVSICSDISFKIGNSKVHLWGSLASSQVTPGIHLKCWITPFKGSKRVPSLEVLNAVFGEPGKRVWDVIAESYLPGMERRSTSEEKQQVYSGGNWWGVNSNQSLSDGSSSIPLCVHVDILCVSGMNEEGINQW